MLVGKLSFWFGFLGLACQIGALALNNWQTASGGVKMGLWYVCTGSSCANIGQDGFSARQWNTLWVVRVLMPISVVVHMIGMYFAAKISVGEGSRASVKAARLLFIITSEWCYLIILFSVLSTSSVQLALSLVTGPQCAASTGALTDVQLAVVGDIDCFS